MNSTATPMAAHLLAMQPPGAARMQPTPAAALLPPDDADLDDDAIQTIQRYIVASNRKPNDAR